MSKKLKILYIINTSIILYSIIAMIIINQNESYGVAALSDLGNFVKWGIIGCISFVVLCGVTIFNLLRAHKLSK